jgi:hypothetical protein
MIKEKTAKQKYKDNKTAVAKPLAICGDGRGSMYTY